jgi:hypothetical protein
MAMVLRQKNEEKILNEAAKKRLCASVVRYGDCAEAKILKNSVP